MIAIVFAVLTVIALPIIAIARAQAKSKEVDALKREVARLGERLAWLERAVSERKREAVVQTENVAAKDLSHVAVEPVSYARSARPGPATDVRNPFEMKEPGTAAAPSFWMENEKEPKSLEHHLGVNWLGRVGITMVVLGVAVFLVYHVSHFGPWVKIAGGFTAALALMVTGLKLEKKEERYKVPAYVALGGAWAVTFLTTYAMHFFDSTKVLNSEIVDLLFLLLVSVGMIAHAIRYRSPLLTGIAFMMAFSTVTMSQHDGYSLIANVLLAGSLVFICLHFDWPEVELAGMVAAYGNHVKWFVTQDWSGPVVPHFWASATVLALLFLIFRMGNLVRRPVGHSPQLERIFIPVLNTALWCALAAGPQSPTKLWAFGFLMMTCVLDFAFSVIAREADATSSKTLEGLALVQLLVAVPFRFEGAALPAVWMLIGAALCLLAVKRAKHAVSAVGIVVICAAIGAIFAAQAASPGVSDRTCAVGLAAAALLLWIESAWLYKMIEAPTTDRVDAMYTGAAFVAAACVAMAAGLVMPGWGMLAAWSVLGVLVFGVGLIATQRRLRLAGLGLLLLAVAKLTAYDAWQFEPTARYLSLIGVGVALLVVSFAYSRYTERIKALL